MFRVIHRYTHIYSQNVLYYLEFCHENNINRIAKLQAEYIHSWHTQILQVVMWTREIHIELLQSSCLYINAISDNSLKMVLINDFTEYFLVTHLVFSEGSEVCRKFRFQYFAISLHYCLWKLHCGFSVTKYDM